MANKFLSQLHRRPVLLVVLLVIVAVVDGVLGGGHHLRGLWDGPI